MITVQVEYSRHKISAYTTGQKVLDESAWKGINEGVGRAARTLYYGEQTPTPKLMRDLVTVYRACVRAPQSRGFEVHNAYWRLVLIRGGEKTVLLGPHVQGDLISDQLMPAVGLYITTAVITDETGEEAEVLLDKSPVAAGTVVTLYDEWGDEIGTSEVT